MHALRLALAFAAVTAPAAPAADWPQWLGPNRDGTSPETVSVWGGPLKELWKLPVGAGHSSPVVAGGRVYLHTKADGKDAELVTAYDAATGKEVWQTRYDRAPFSSQFGVGPRATPAVAGGKLYTFGVTGILSCYDAAKGGQPLWQIDTLKRFDAKNLFFGVSASPLVDGGRVVVPVGGPGAGLVAFDAASGEVAWKSLDDPASYAAPVKLGGQLVALTQLGLTGLAPADGAKLWAVPFKDKLFESSTTPIKSGELLIGSSVTLGSIAVRPAAKAGGPTEVVWKNPALSCYFSTPVPVSKDHLYMVTGTILPPPNVVLRCVETATGKEVWSRPKVGKYHAALLRTGDGKLLLHSDDGSLALLAPDTTGYKELARAKVCGPTWAHPALADGRLYLRDERELICLQLGK
jgi:outer membrane protein assembly factor BamB